MFENLRVLDNILCYEVNIQSQHHSSIRGPIFNPDPTLRGRRESEAFPFLRGLVIADEAAELLALTRRKCGY